MSSLVFVSLLANTASVGGASRRLMDASNASSSISLTTQTQAGWDSGETLTRSFWLYAGAENFSTLCSLGPTREKVLSTLTRWQPQAARPTSTTDKLKRRRMLSIMG